MPDETQRRERPPDVRRTGADAAPGHSNAARFLLLCALCALLTGAYAWFTLAGSTERAAEAALPPNGRLGVGETSRSHRSPDPSDSAGDEPVAPAPARQFLVRHTGLNRSHGFLAVESDLGGARTRRATPLMCHRLHFAAGRGSCLVVERDFFTTYTAVLFDAAFRPRHRIPLNGIPSRTRVSPDGRRAAITVFVSGHSYADSLFSTETSIVDTETGAPLVANLEELPVLRDGQRFHALDFNFWGVTFAADGDRFFVTLGTGGTVYLVEGSLAERTMRVFTEGIECPALSPDETRVAFKKRMPGSARPHWRPHVLDLATLEETALAETRNVDDQVEWLDDGSILYALPEEPGSPIAHVWVVPADGSGRPEIFLDQASSPTVLRGGASVTTTIDSQG